jgi:hypothetical protein
MLLGQRLINVQHQIGQKLKPSIQLGQRVIHNYNKLNNFINSADNVHGEVKKIYSNLEKLNARKRLQQ